MKATKERAIQSLLLDHPEILFAYLFGSQVGGDTTPMSDTDIAIYTCEPLSFDQRVQLLASLMQCLQSNAVDLVDLRQAPPVIAHEVVTSGRLLFSRDEDAQNRFEENAHLRYVEFYLPTLLPD